MYVIIFTISVPLTAKFYFSGLACLVCLPKRVVCLPMFFSLLGKLSRRAIYFADVFFSFSPIPISEVNLLKSELAKNEFLCIVQNFLTFGLVIPVFTLLTMTPFVAILQKSTYHAKYLRMSWTYLDLLYRFGSRIGRDDYPDIHLAVAQRTLLWQPVIWEMFAYVAQNDL